MEFTQESIVFLVHVRWAGRRKESSRSLSHLLMSFLLNSNEANRDHGVPRVILFKASFFSFHDCEYKQFKH